MITQDIKEKLTKILKSDNWEAVYVQVIREANPTILGYEMDYDPMSGVIHFVKDEDSISFAATPCWEESREEEVLMIDITSPDGDFEDVLTPSFEYRSFKVDFWGAYCSTLSQYITIMERVISEETEKRKNS